MDKVVTILRCIYAVKCGLRCDLLFWLLDTVCGCEMGSCHGSWSSKNLIIVSQSKYSTGSGLSTCYKFTLPLFLFLHLIYLCLLAQFPFFFCSFSSLRHTPSISSTPFSVWRIVARVIFWVPSFCASFCAIFGAVHFPLLYEKSLKHSWII